MATQKEEQKQKKIDTLYLDITKRISEMSYAVRKKVACLLVKDNNIISFGWNGTPNGDDNCCEIKSANGELITKPEVLHSEFNAISKLSKSTNSSDGAEIYLTLSPCLECAKLIFQSGIKRVIYSEEYRNVDGIVFLKDRGIKVVYFPN